MPPLDELSIIERLRPLAGVGAFDFLDDAGALSVPDGCELVVTTDMIASGVHFLPEDPAETVAQKALRVNLSDLAAKGAEPLAYTLGFGVGAIADQAWVESFVSGLGVDQQRFGVSLLGGDTIVLGSGAVISIAAFGVVCRGRMVRRSGGRPGDALFVSGTIGAASTGLAILKGVEGPWSNIGDFARGELVRRYRVPEPRTMLAPILAEFASAAMDVSDGLIGDCDKLALASGCSASLDADAVPFPPGLTHCMEPVVATMLTGGDDYEILAAIPVDDCDQFVRAAQAVGVHVSRIGALVGGTAPTQATLNGRELNLRRRSYVHGRTGLDR